MNFFFSLLKSNWTLTEFQDTTKSRILTGIYKRQTDSFPVPFSSLTSTWEKRYLRFRLDQLKSVNVNSFVINKEAFNISFEHYYPKSNKKVGNGAHAPKRPI